MCGAHVPTVCVLQSCSRPGCPLSSHVSRALSVPLSLSPASLRRTRSPRSLRASKLSASCATLAVHPCRAPRRVESPAKARKAITTTTRRPRARGDHSNVCEGAGAARDKPNALSFSWHSYLAAASPKASRAISGFNAVRRRVGRVETMHAQGHHTHAVPEQRAPHSCILQDSP